MFVAMSLIIAILCICMLCMNDKINKQRRMIDELTRDINKYFRMIRMIDDIVRDMKQDGWSCK